MKYAVIAMVLALGATEANAAVYCAAGVYHAGCVRRPAAGAVVVAPRPMGAAVVAPRCRMIDGRRICR